MGSIIEINDTLKISKDRGFPLCLSLEEHIKNPNDSEGLVGVEREFKNPGIRLYNLKPSRVFLVEELPDGKWLYWGHAQITTQMINQDSTSGKYKITKIYDPEYQRLVTINESPKGKSYF